MMQVVSSTNRVSLMFSIANRIGSLSQVLDVMKDYKINLGRIESRPSRSKSSNYDFFVDIDDASEKVIAQVLSLSHPSISLFSQVIDRLNELGIATLGDTPMISQTLTSNTTTGGHMQQGINHLHRSSRLISASSLVPQKVV